MSTHQPAPDPASPLGFHYSRHAPWSTVRSWVRAHTVHHTGICDDCGTRLRASAQYLVASQSTLYRHACGVHAEPGDTTHEPPQWARVCPHTHTRSTTRRDDVA